MSGPYILKKGVSQLDDLADGVLAALPFTGNKIWLDPANGSNSNSGKRPDQAFATLVAAEDALIANQHDVLLYIAGPTTLTNLSAKLTWDKSYTHFIGVCAPTMVGQRARIFQKSDATSLAPLIDITASGCMFTNLYIFQGVNNAASKVNVQVTGGRNYFKNVHFAGGGHAACAVDGGTNLYLNGAAENTFEDCVLGVDTAVQATGWAALLLDAEAKRNVFRKCLLQMYAGATSCYFVEVADSGGVDRWNLFQECLGINSCRSYSLGTCFNIPASMTSVTNFLLLDRTCFVGCDEIDSNNRSMVYLTNGAITAGGTSGIMQASNTT